MNLKNIKLRERSHTQKSSLWIVPLMQHSGIGKTKVMKYIWISSCQGLNVGRGFEQKGTVWRIFWDDRFTCNQFVVVVYMNLYVLKLIELIFKKLILLHVKI